MGEVEGDSEISGLVTGKVGMPIIKSEETKAGAHLEQWQDHDYDFGF